MQELHFEVQGSTAEPYIVTFVRNSETNLSAFCNCPAGVKGQYCKHRFNILSGSTKDIVSDNESDVSIVKSWFKGSELETAIEKMNGLEVEATKIKKALSAAKKDVAKAMKG